MVEDLSSRQLFKCLKEFPVSNKVDATVFNIICLDAGITATIEVLKRTLTDYVREDTEQSGEVDCERLIEVNYIRNHLKSTGRG